MAGPTCETTPGPAATSAGACGPRRTRDPNRARWRSWRHGRLRSGRHVRTSRLEPLPHRERDVAEVGAGPGEHDLAQQPVRDVLVAHDRQPLAVGLLLLADHLTAGLQVELRLQR